MSTFQNDDFKFVENYKSVDNYVSDNRLPECLFTIESKVTFPTPPASMRHSTPCGVKSGMRSRDRSARAWHKLHFQSHLRPSKAVVFGLVSILLVLPGEPKLPEHTILAPLVAQTAYLETGSYTKRANLRTPKQLPIDFVYDGTTTVAFESPSMGVNWEHRSMPPRLSDPSFNYMPVRVGTGSLAQPHANSRALVWTLVDVNEAHGLRVPTIPQATSDVKLPLPQLAKVSDAEQAPLRVVEVVSQLPVSCANALAHYRNKHQERQHSLLGQPSLVVLATSDKTNGISTVNIFYLHVQESDIGVLVNSVHPAVVNAPFQADDKVIYDRISGKKIRSVSNLFDVLNHQSKEPRSLANFVVLRSDQMIGINLEPICIAIN